MRNIPVDEYAVADAFQANCHIFHNVVCPCLAALNDEVHITGQTRACVSAQYVFLKNHCMYCMPTPPVENLDMAIAHAFEFDPFSFVSVV